MIEPIVFLHYVVLFTALNVDGQLLTTYVMFQNQVVYGCFIVGMVSAVFYGITFFRRLHDFQGNLDLFIPENQVLEDKIEPRDIKVDAKTL